MLPLCFGASCSTVCTIYVELSLFTRRNVVSILIVTFFAEFAFGAEHTMEEILYCEVIRLEELTKEAQYM